MSDLMSQSYHDVMEVYKRPMSVKYIPTIFWAFVSVISLSFAFPAMAHADVPVLYVQVYIRRRIRLGECSLVRCEWIE